MVRTVRVARAPSEKALRCAGSFALAIRVVPGGAGRARVRVDTAALAALARDVARCDAAIVLVHGASGAGKSLVLDRLARRLRGRGVGVVHAKEPSPALFRCAAIDAVPGGMMLSRRLLIAAGLGDAMSYLRAMGELSVGQRHRALIARAVGCALRRGGGVVFIDEFCSGLDSMTARSLCDGVAACVREALALGSRVCVVVASSDERVREWLDGDIACGCVWLGTAGVALDVRIRGEQRAAA